MAPITTATVSLAEYLSTSYKPDKEYVDGVLEERNAGTKHGVGNVCVIPLARLRNRAATVRERMRKYF